MFVAQAKQYVGQTCEVWWADRHGNNHHGTMRIDDVTFVPMYGACLLTSTGDIRLDRVREIKTTNRTEAA